MLTSRIIPCLDVRDGRVVKGVQFQGLRDAGDPAALATAYERAGADEIVVLDISATPEGRSTQAETVRRVRAGLSIPLTVGGGVRSAEDARTLLEAGADKVGINTAAVTTPEIITAIAEQFGSQCTVVALDAATRSDPNATRSCSDQEDQPGNPGPRSPWEVVILSGKKRTGIDAIAWAQEVQTHGAGEILLTSWDRDGTRSGYDLALLQAVSARISVPLIASGGADTPEHLVDALRAGADAVLAASIFHDGDYTPADLKRHLARAGIEVRQ